MTTKKTTWMLPILIVLGAWLLCGCGSSAKLKDGFYTAQMSDYSHGWKEYLCIMVKDNIVYAEFNAKNPSGYIKAWDNAYMENMAAVETTYPNDYTRKYVAQLIKVQGSDGLDTVSGATHSGNNFVKLAAAVIGQAEKGDPDIVTVQSESE